MRHIFTITVLACLSLTGCPEGKKAEQTDAKADEKKTDAKADEKKTD
jgi:hypothetical protein